MKEWGIINFSIIILEEGKVKGVSAETTKDKFLVENFYYSHGTR
jgi:hypothetical protein